MLVVKKNILGVKFADLTTQEVLEYIVAKLQKNNKKFYIFTPNPEILVMSMKNKSYKKVLNSADLALADGIGVVLAAKLLKKDLKQRIPGVDLVEMLCRYVSKRPITVSFLGGEPKIAEQTAECLKKHYSSLKIAFVGQNPPKNLENLKSDILFVAFGSPKQEIWIYENIKRIPIRLAIGIGGSFDFISGSVLRAPKFIREVGLEWLFRLIIQPWRIRRQFALIKFIGLVLREKFNL